jgi:NAD(P)-dependent dehydrogenase (short-subunit alcohol dehydrogenase family)
MAAAAELDVRDGAAFQRLVETTLGDWGRLDFLFNNAGIAVAGEVADFTPADWDDVIDVNLGGVVHGILAAYPRMVEQRFGHIVNVGSVSGLIPGLLQGSYTASKFAVVGLSRALRIEARRYGVKVSVVCPGAVRTPILRGGRYGRVRSGLDVDSLAARIERLGAMEPALLARRVLRAVERNRGIIVEPRSARLVWYLDRLSPWLSERLWRAALDRVK